MASNPLNSDASMKKADKNEILLDIATRRLFILPGNEIYGQVSGFYDYGPLGCLLKKKIENAWRSYFIKEDGFLEIESSIVHPEIVVKASGHLDSFTDPMAACGKCHKTFRADHLIEEHYKAQGKEFKAQGIKLGELAGVLREIQVKCACGGMFSEPNQFNLMFKTAIGTGFPAYLRPETAQGIFLDFYRIYTNGGKFPIGIGQVGKSFRNEISPRKGLVRMREFTQMEIEYFFDPQNPDIYGYERVNDFDIRLMGAVGEGKIEALKAGDAVEEGKITNKILAYFMAKQAKFYTELGIPFDKFYFRQLGKDEMPHYSLGNYDLEVEIGDSVIETVGNAYRADYDLSQHAKFSHKDLSIIYDNKRFVPHVVEPSMGVDRTLWCVLTYALREPDAAVKKEWHWFDFPPAIAPYQIAVYPLVKKDGLAEKGRELVAKLRKRYDVEYDEKGSIGKRYAKSDEIGTYLSITVDYDTMEGRGVTIRHRNSGGQVRVQPGNLEKALALLIEDGLPFEKLDASIATPVETRKKGIL